ncbi:MAG: hypothetical protein QNJ56_09390 [Gammaproteobacteria bacterium]|nr:hypothetical protein [Gammaproteobacteria bacterium]
MDENEYRSAYQGINTLKCVFEKSILTQNCGCRFHEKFNLAEREGIRCTDEDAHKNCSHFLNSCRKQAQFALHLTEIVGNLLPHSKEVQVQKGALLGLAPDLPNLPDTRIDDIAELIDKAVEESDGNILAYPYQELIPSISHHPPRPRRSRRKKHKD